MPGEFRQDPTFLRSKGKEIGRDGCRVPIPWEKDAPSFGFGPADQTWLPQPAIYGDYAVDQQDGVDGSTLELYRTAAADRGASASSAPEACGSPTGSATTWSPWSTPARATDTLVLANLGAEPVALPDGATVVVASGAADRRRPGADRHHGLGRSLT